jgi:hypothetical protein
MTCRDLIVDAQRFKFCPEDPIAATNHTQAVVLGRFLDELTGREMSADISVTTDVLGLTPKIGFGGIAGLVGRPGRLYPSLGVVPVSINMTVSATRFVTRQLESTLLAAIPEDLGDVMMHRQAVVLRGRVVRAGGVPRLPLAGVSIWIDGIWRMFPPADVDPLTVIEAPNLVSLQPGLYAERFSGIDVLRRRNVTFAAGEEKLLTRPAIMGERTIRISDRLNLNPGDLLAIDSNQPDIMEYIVVAAIDLTSTDDQPATITLNFPLAFDHAEETVVVRSILQPPGNSNGVVRDGIPNDQTVFLSALTDLTVSAIVEITGSGDPEYQTMSLYQAASDAEGYFRLPPISRVAQLMLHAERADLPHDMDILLNSNYDYFENYQNIVF